MMMFSRGIVLLQDLGDHAGAHGAAALADREAQLLLHRDRRDQLDRHLRVVPRHHHLHPCRQLHRPRHVRRPEIKLRPVPLEERRVPPPLLLRQHVHLTLKLRVRRDRLRLRQHHPPLHLVLLHAAQQQPHVVPRLPLVQELAEHLHPRHHRLLVRPKPHHLHFLPHLHLPPLHPPRRHPPRALIENTSSTGIRNGLSTSRFGTGMLLSSAANSSSTFTTHCFSPAIAFKAEPRITGMSSPGYSYFDSSSRTSSSTRSNSSASSTRSHLLRRTTIAGTFTCRANRMCSRVCGIGPSTADTTRIAPSIWASPVIMFFT